MMTGIYMTLQQKRLLSIAGIFIASGFFIYLGEDWLISSVPAKYIGYIVAAVAVAGLLGINIWAGGPLDKKLDAQQENETADK